MDSQDLKAEKWKNEAEHTPGVFSPTVNKALKDIYYSYDIQKAVEAASFLEAASDAGDGDATYILSRCFCGPEYSWEFHPFTEDDAMARKLTEKSIRQGSAMGVLGAMRIGILSPKLEKEMPFDSLSQVWDIIREKALAGSPFCQNMIGNTYFWLDIVRIQGISDKDFPSRAKYAKYLRETQLECIPWFEKAYRGGMGHAGRNLFNLYFDGDEGTFEPQPQKADEVVRMGAELGYPDWQERYARQLSEEEGREAEAFSYFLRAAEQGQITAWGYVGNAYQYGEGTAKDVRRALECYEKGMDKSYGCCNGAGELYFLGQDGIPQDYAKAVRCFEQARAQGSDWGNDMLGLCYLLGQGCVKDPVKARELFLDADDSDLKNYGLGLIYADGLGVPEDIRLGVEFLKKAKDYEPAKEALTHYKRGILGKWSRR